MPLIPYAEHEGAIYDIDLNAPPEDRWTEAAEAMGDHIHALLAHLREVTDDQLPSSWMRGAATLAVGKGIGISGGDFAREIKCIADTVGVSFNELATGNIAYELIGHGSNFNLCSSGSYDGPKGHPVLARTLDWSLPDSIGEHSVHLRFHQGRKHYDAFGVAGMVGLLSAQRPGAWAMTLNMAPNTASLLQILQRPVCFHLRQCADEAMTYRSLVKRVMEHQTGSSFFAHIVGVNAGQRTVITGYGDRYEQLIAPPGIPLAITNHYMDDEDAGEAESGSGSSVQRLRLLQNRLNRVRALPATKAMKLLVPNITCSNTQQSMVLCPGTGHADFRVLPNDEWSVGTADCPYCGEEDIPIRQGPGDYECPACSATFSV